MSNIFVNGISAKSGGGKSILNNYLKVLKSTQRKHKYYVLTPSKKDYLKYSNESIKIIDISNFYKKGLMFPWIYEHTLPLLLKKLNIDVVFNLADIPIAFKGSQVFLFDWPYGVYPESIVWKKMDLKSFLTRKIKLFFFKKNLKYVSVMIAQTDTIKKRLEKIYKIENIKIVPNAVSLENMDVRERKDFKLPKGLKLLYLSYYYPHKNFEIFIPLAQEIKKRSLDYKIITTIDKSQHKKAEIFLNNVKKKRLEDIIINVGSVEMKHVPSLYKQCDALLMPTLLESFSGTYVEAMYHKLPIFTSDIDFAKGVCYDSASYFNPLDSNSILLSLDSTFKNEDLKLSNINKGTKILNSLPDWNKAYFLYSKLIEESI